jgi:hypothetical protein
VKLLRGIASLVCFGTRNRQQRKLGFDCANPSNHIEWIVRLGEKRGLRSQKILIARLLRLMSVMPTSLLLLGLHQLPQDLDLSSQDLRNALWWRWRRWIAISSGSKASGTTLSRTNHLKRE